MEIIRNANPAWGRKKFRPGPAPTYPIHELGVGDVLRIPPEQQTGAKFTSVRSLVSAKQKQLKMKFRCRQLDDGTIEIARVG